MARRDSEKTRQYMKDYYPRYYRKHRKKILKRTAKYQKENPEKRLKHSRSHDLRKKGWTPELYDKRFKEQKGLCAICEKPVANKKRLNADHDHDTLAPRGLLCQTCNAGIGMLQDSPRLLNNAIKYLRRYKKHA